MRDKHMWWFLAGAVTGPVLAWLALLAIGSAMRCIQLCP